jgi:dTDP-glucose 4,6-dehydratase
MLIFNELMTILGGAKVIFNFAAESHVDNSIHGADAFIDTNILGVQKLGMWCTQHQVPLFQISTDEVYGDTDFTATKEHRETDVLCPSNPYSATKAAADLMIGALQRTHGLTYQIVRMTNNYGPGQHPEKFVPTVIRSILKNTPIPLYGKGTNRREWIFVRDACASIWKIWLYGKKNNIYHIGHKENRMSNRTMIRSIIDTCIEHPHEFIRERAKNCATHFVQDRPGHDRRYALDCSKTNKLFSSKHDIINYTDLHDGLRETIDHYTKYIYPAGGDVHENQKG